MISSTLLERMDLLDFKDEIIQLCLKKDENNLSFRQIGDKFGLSKDCIRGIFRRWKDKQVEPIGVNVDNKLPENDLFNKIKIERQKLNQEKQEIRKFVKKFANFELIIEEIQDGISRLPSLPYYKLHNIYNNDRELVMMLSDSHLGEDVDLSPINKYNSNIIKDRITKYFSEVVNIAEEHNVNKINLCLLGDLVTNYNVFKSQIDQNDLDPISQIIELSEILSQLINELSMKFSIEIYYVFGNHGLVDRLLRKTINYERLVIEFIKIRLENNDNIKIHNSNGIWSIMKVFDCEYLLVHGDNTDDKNAPYRLKDIFNNIGYNFTEILMAHNHHNIERELFSNGYGVLVNSSITGANDYSFNKLQVTSKSSQTCFVVEKNKKRTATYRVKLN